MQIYCFSPFGYEGSLVSVEVDLRRGIPAVDIVGLADGAVKESRERMRSAIRNCGFDFPPERVLISLAPADLKKEGAGFDLAIALAVLSASCKGADKAELLDEPVLVIGELELNGRLRPVRGIHAAASTARAGGIRACVVPAANAQEAREIDGMRVFGADNLTEAYNALARADSFSQKDSGSEMSERTNGAVNIGGVLFPQVDVGFEYADIAGQGAFVRALQVAAAGGHNVLAYGPPGCGKTLAMQKFPALLPLLTCEEAQPVTRIYSIAGLLAEESPIARNAPFRQPHQSATIEGMCGGGVHCTPGEISLAHNGVLFLDEAAEFKTSVLQMLRVPLESGAITLSRAGRSTVFPAAFQLLMATNPCPCGNYGSADKICLCSSRAIEQYWKKFSAPLLDRIDIRVKVEGARIAEQTGVCATSEANAELPLTEKPAQERQFPPTSTAELRKDIARAVDTQRKRQGKRNARLLPEEVAEFCKCTAEAKSVLDKTASLCGFSPRGIAACLKLSRTISDMNGEEIIGAQSIREALFYRKSGGEVGEVAGIM